MQVYDVAWSPTGEYIIAGSTDNAARIFQSSDGAFYALLIVSCSSPNCQENAFMKLLSTIITCKEFHGTLSMNMWQRSPQIVPCMSTVFRHRPLQGTS